MLRNVFFIFLLSFAFVAHSQTVGLVLSGGGAKGMAHIGAIRALEENGIPINYITGTSIGAIIGGLYAAGYSTDEMEAIFLNPDFDNWIKGRIDEEHVYHFKQDIQNSAWVGFRFDVDSTRFLPTIPINIITPVQMDFVFLEIFSAIDAVSNQNFDNLFVPFRCIATDITNNKEIVFKSGYLKDAIRASMTFPFYFRPISIQNSMLYDGGMLNNFPADVMQNDFNPDYIIGVTVTKPNQAPSDQNLISVLNNMLMNKESYTLKGASKGIVIRADIPSTNVTNFANTSSFIQIGYKTTLDSIPRIKESVYDSVPYEDVVLRRLRFKEKIPDIFIDEIEVRGLNSAQAEYIREGMIQANEVLSLRSFKRRYFKLVFEDYIANVYPFLNIDTTTNKYKAILDVTVEKPFKLDFGGYISTNAYTTFFLRFNYYLWRKQLMNVSLEAYFGRYYNSVVASYQRTRLKHKPFEQTFTLGYSRWDYFNTYRIFTDSETPSYLIHDETVLNYNVSYFIRNKSRFIGNLTFFSTADKYYWNSQYLREDSRDRNQAYMVRPDVIFEYNTIDYRYFATKGFRLKVDVAYFAGYEINRPGTTSPQEENTTNFRHWFAVNGEAEKLFRLSKHYRLGLSTHLAWSNLPMFESFNATKLRANHYSPTHESTMAYLPNYRDPIFITVGLSNTFCPYKKLQFRLDGYYYQPFFSILRKELNKPEMSLTLFERRAFIAYTSLAYLTKLGPIAVNVSWYSHNYPEFLFNISFGYLLFNNKIF